MSEPLPPSAFLVGKKVFLRPFDESDVDVAHRTVSNPEIRDQLLVTFPFTRAAELAWIASNMTPGEEVTFLVAERGTNRGLGSCTIRGMHPVFRHGEVGIAINEAEDRGKGYGAEALALLLAYGFRDLNLHRLWLHVFDGNPSERLYRRLGFRDEGVLREHVWKGGRWMDVRVMGLLRDEWQPPRP